MRTAELAAQADDLGRYLDEQRERERRQWHQDYDRRQALMEQVRALAEEPLPQVRRSFAEYQAFKRRWDRSHLGGIDGCTCPSHRAYRGEE